MNSPLRIALIGAGNKGQQHYPPSQIPDASDALRRRRSVGCFADWLRMQEKT